jgi:hypothetical protein
MWLTALPEHVVTGDARLCLARAWTSFAKGALDEVLPCVENAEAAPAPARCSTGRHRSPPAPRPCGPPIGCEWGLLARPCRTPARRWRWSMARGARFRRTAWAPPSIGSSRLSARSAEHRERRDRPRLPAGGSVRDRPAGALGLRAAGLERGFRRLHGARQMIDAGGLGESFRTARRAANAA